jgi:hypothetical protein
MVVDCVFVNSIGEDFTSIQSHANVFGIQVGERELGILVILVKDECI